MFKKYFGIAALFLAAGCATDRADANWADTDKKIVQLMASEDVKGLAYAVIEGGQVAHVAAFGHRNVEQNAPLENDTIMYGASLTKTAFAYMVMQLVDEGEFDLDKPLTDYLAKPLPDYGDYADLADDPRWGDLTARHAFTHSTGFANFRWLEDDRKLKFNFTPGDRYAYSGEGFYLVQFILEEGLGLNVKQEMQRRVFDRFAMTDTSMQWRDDFAGRLADGYGVDGGFEPHDKRDNVSAAGSMDTTIADQARLWAGMLRGDGLSDMARAEFTRAQRPITSASQFPTLRTASDPRAQEIAMAAGVGMVTYQGKNGVVWFKGGHNPWTGNMAICQEVQQRCVVMLANSVRAELIYPAVVSLILGDTPMPWWWEYSHVQ